MSEITPEINIKFLENATNDVEIKPKGHVVLIIKDNVLQENIKIFKKISEVEGISDDNLEYVKDVFVGGCEKVTILNVTDTNTIDKVLKRLDNINANYVGVLSSESSDHQALSKYIKIADKKLRTLKAITYNIANQDCMHIINVVNEKITFKDGRKEQDGYKVIPYLLGVLSGMPLTKGSTNFNLTELSNVKNVEDTESEVEKGNLVLNFSGEEVSIVAGVNTLTTVDKEHSESMKSIVILESIDLMRDDIKENFKIYIGKYKNSYSIQMMIITAIKAYFKELARLEVLDSEYNNTITQDVEAMRIYWGSKGIDVSKLTDGEIRKRTCGKNVYLVSDVKMLEVIENFDLKVFLTV